MSESQLLIPKLSFCPFCGGVPTVKRDKNGRPYLRCPHCLTMLFMHTDTGIVGLEVLTDMIKANLPAYVAECQKRLRSINNERELKQTMAEMEAEEKTFARVKTKTSKQGTQGKED